MKRILLMLLLVLLFNSCFHVDKVRYGEKLYIKNLTDEVIYICISCDTTLHIEDSVCIFDNGNKNDVYEISRLKPNMTKAYHNNKILDKNLDKKLICPNENLSVFILQDSIINNYSWNEIIEKQLLKDKLILSEEDLDSLEYDLILGR